MWLVHGLLQDSDPTVEYTSRQIRYGFTVKNIIGRPAENVSLWVYAPVRRTATQICDTVSASHPYTLRTDCLGNQILHFSFDVIAPYASEIVSIQAGLRIWDHFEKSALSNRSSRAFLDPEPYVESDHPAIVAQAKLLELSNDRDTVESIFQWVADHIDDAGYLRRAQGAVNALLHRKGDCTEYMDLFVALCRAAGIPGKRIGGYVTRGNAVVTAAGYHNWAEFYSGGKWYVADPQSRVFMKDATGYIATRIIGDHCPNEMKNYNRYRFEGEGITVKMNR